MWKIALKSLLGHKLRMLFTAFSIIIGVSFVAGSYIFTDSISATFNGVFDDVYTSVDVVVRPKDTSSSSLRKGLDQSLLESLANVDGIRNIEGDVAGEAYVVLEDGSLTGLNGPPSLGFAWGRVPALNPVNIRDGNGRAPDQAGEVVIDVNTAKQNEIIVGQVIDIQAGEFEAQQFTVTGLGSFGEADTLAGATLVLFEFEKAQQLFGLEGRVSTISMTANNNVSPEQLQQAVSSALPDEAEAIVGTQQRDEDLEEINSSLNVITTALLAFAGVSVFVGAFIIQNTFRIIIAQRSKELALLRAIGAAKNQIIRLVAYEALVVSVIASLLGIVIGMGLATVVRWAINSTGAAIPDGPLTLEPRTVYISLAVGVIVTLLSALMPAIKASRVAPVEAMRDSEATTPRRSLQKRAVLGFAVTGLGTAALSYGLFSSVKDPVYYVGFGAAVMFLGVSVLAPLLTKPIANTIGFVTDAIYGIVGRIAKQNAKRSPRRTASTAAALMVGVALVSFATIFASSAKATIDDVFTSSFPGDILVTSRLLEGGQSDPFEATFSPEIAERVAQLPEVEQVTRLRYDEQVGVNGGDGQLVIGIEPETFNAAFSLKPQSGSYSSLTDSTIYVRQVQLDELGLSIGDTIELEFERTGVQQYRIADSFEEAFDGPYLISVGSFTANSNIEGDLTVVANAAPGVTLDDAREAVTAELANFPLVQVQDKNEIIAEVRTQIDTALSLLTALLGFAIIIAVLGITNTLTLSVSERTREIGMLRAIGMTRRQVRRMIRVESIIIAIFGALLGMVMGIFFGWALLKSLEDLGFSAFSVPFLQLGRYLIMAIAAGIIAAVFPSFKASRMNILKAINYE